MFSLELQCHTFIGFNTTPDCRIYLFWRLVKIDIRQYGRRFAYSSRNFISFTCITETVFRQFLKYLEELLFKIIFKSTYPLDLPHLVVSGAV